MFFFSVGEAATSKWTHGEVAVFGSTVYKIFALKWQKLRTPQSNFFCEDKGHSLRKPLFSNQLYSTSSSISSRGIPR